MQARTSNIHVYDVGVARFLESPSCVTVACFPILVAPQCAIAPCDLHSQIVAIERYQQKRQKQVLAIDTEIKRSPTFCLSCFLGWLMGCLPCALAIGHVHFLLHDLIRREIGQVRTNLDEEMGSSSRLHS